MKVVSFLFSRLVIAPAILVLACGVGHPSTSFLTTATSVHENEGLDRKEQHNGSLRRGQESQEEDNGGIKAFDETARKKTKEELDGSTISSIASPTFLHSSEEITRHAYDPNEGCVSTPEEFNRALLLPIYFRTINDNASAREKAKEPKGFWRPIGADWTITI